MIGATTPRRIVVGLDSSAHARAAMEAAAELAMHLQAELTAVFVEDVDLVRIAALDFVHEIGSDASLRPFDIASLERRFRCDVREARAVCLQAANRRQIKARFRVVRGAVAAQILAAAAEAAADLVILGRTSAASEQFGSGRVGTPLRRRIGPLGRTARSVLATSPGTVAIVSAERGIGNPVAVVFDRGEASRRALDLAIRLAGQDHNNLVVLLPKGSVHAADLVSEATAVAAQAGIIPRCILLHDGAGAIAQVVLENDCRVVVVARDCSLVAPDGSTQLVESIDCPVFVVG
jgi:nucleotide-binding universal stress UspA family protein